MREMQDSPARGSGYRGKSAHHQAPPWCAKHLPMLAEGSEHHQEGDGPLVARAQPKGSASGPGVPSSPAQLLASLLDLYVEGGFRQEGCGLPPQRSAPELPAVLPT